MEDLSTEQYAEMIADSITNGQREQARNQFKRAIADNVNARSLVEDMSGMGIDKDDILTLLCNLIERLIA